MEIGEKIRTARDKLGLTQAKLAEKVGLASAQTVSDIERGVRELKAAEAGRIARVLHLDYWDLALPDAQDAEQQQETRVIWRKNAGVSPEAEQRFLKKCSQYKLLEEAVGLQQNRSLFEESFDITDAPYRQASTIARRASREFGLGDRPGPSLAEMLENEYNVKVWYFDLGSEGSSACANAEFGKGILVNATEAPWRRNWDFAHELFHLVTWSDTCSILENGAEENKELLESCANAFAAALLLPSEEVGGIFDKNVEDGEISYKTLVNIAREFEVSTEALLYRLHSLGRLSRKAIDDLLNDEEFRSLDRMSMPSKWWQPPELPERFARTAFFAHKEGKLSRARLAEFLETDLLRLPDKLEEYCLHNELDYNKTLCAD
ncbi:MAG: helix-turn-helix domain-containing protein [Candidatus Brocadiia bacterium]